MTYEILSLGAFLVGNQRFHPSCIPWSLGHFQVFYLYLFVMVLSQILVISVGNVVYSDNPLCSNSKMAVGENLLILVPFWRPFHLHN